MRLIDADALVKSIRLDISITGKENAETVVNVLNEIMAKIADAPTVQGDRPHGEWIEPQLIYTDAHKVTCTNCGGKVVIVGETNFCPNCGARMKGGDDE